MTDSGAEGAFLLHSNGQMTRLEGQRGTTPPCPEARHQAEDVVRIRRRKHLRHLPEIGAVVVVIPPGFSPDWAMDDLWSKPRRLMCQVGARDVTYFIGFEGDRRPHLMHERDLLPTGEKAAAVQLVAAGAP
jgi:hypothetical protein